MEAPGGSGTDFWEGEDAIVRFYFSEACRSVANLFFLNKPQLDVLLLLLMLPRGVYVSKQSSIASQEMRRQRRVAQDVNQGWNSLGIRNLKI